MKIVKLQQSVADKRVVVDDDYDWTNEGDRETAWTGIRVSLKASAYWQERSDRVTVIHNRPETHD